METPGFEGGAGSYDLSGIYQRLETLQDNVEGLHQRLDTHLVDFADFTRGLCGFLQ